MRLRPWLTKPSCSRFQLPPPRVTSGTRRGVPLFVHGDSAWSMIAAATREKVEHYLADRRSRGFNTVLVSLIEHRFSQNPPANAYGINPFTSAGDFTTPNEAYFEHAGLGASAGWRAWLRCTAHAGLFGLRGWRGGFVSRHGSRRGRPLAFLRRSSVNAISPLGTLSGCKPGISIHPIRQS